MAEPNRQFGYSGIGRLIEERYANLKTDYRKPGIEYTQGYEIRDALLEVAPHRQDLLNMSDEQMMEEYTKWYMACKKAKKSTSELCLPDLE